MHKTPEDAAKAVLTGDLGPLQLSFSQFRTRMITEYPYVLSDTVLHDLYLRFSEPDPDIVMPRLVELLKEEPPWAKEAELSTYFTIHLNETRDPSDVFGPINIEGLAKEQGDQSSPFPAMLDEKEDLLALIEKISRTEGDHMQELQDRILRFQLAERAAKKKEKRQRVLKKVRNKFRRR